MAMKIRLGPAGVHLFWRDTGLNILCNEIRVPQPMWDSAPRQVSVALTNSCDLKCPYCYAPKNANRLEFETLLRWLIDLDANGSLGIGFGGGEPTLYPRFAELCGSAARLTNLAVTFTTHGHRISEEMATQLKGSVHFIRVSMDGVGETYEELRGKKFSELLQRLTLIGRIAPMGINFVVNSRTVQSLEPAIQVAEEIHAKEFLILPEQPVEGVGGMDEWTRKELNACINRYAGLLRVTISANSIDDSMVCAMSEWESDVSAYAHVDAAGHLKKSSFDRQGVPIGEDGIMRALQMLREQETT